MSLEAKIEALTAAIAELNTNLTSGQFTAPAANDAPSTTAVDDQEKPAPEGNDKAEPALTWYHKPETREVWQEPEQGRRKGIVKIDPATAERLQAQYAEEDEQAEQEAAAQAAGSGDDDLDLDMGAEEPQDEPMDDTEFAAAWKDWTTRAMKHLVDAGKEKADAQTEVKKFIVPKVRSFVSEGDVKVGNVPADRRREFLAEAETFFD